MDEKDFEQLSAEDRLALLESGDLDDQQLLRLIQVIEANDELAVSQGLTGNDSGQESAELRRALLAADGLGLVKRIRELKPNEMVADTPFDRLETRNEDREIDRVVMTNDIPEQIGRFEIEREIGRGGFGVVWLAYDPKLRRKVALKIPRAEVLLGGDSQDRFEREAHAAAILSHPAIIPIYETGKVGPIHYIAFAYCNGPSLAKWFVDHDRRIDGQLAARIVQRLAEALQHAHTRGVIHRDLKPGNVLLDFSTTESGDRNGTAVVQALRIADFGLARMDDGNPQHLTRTGALVGTPAFMSPEQANGENAITPSSDIYSLGAILYYLLSGQPPIKRNSDLATLKAVVSDEPSSLRSFDGRIPRDLEAICLKCLEKKPQHRYISAQELEDDLSQFLAGKPVTARPVSSLTRFSRWCSRNPWLAASTAMLFLVLVAGTAVSTTLWLAAERSTAQAVTQTKRIRQAVDDLLIAIADEPTIRSKDLESFRRTLLNSASNFYEQLWNERPSDPELQRDFVETLYRLALIHSRLDDHAKAVNICEQALSLLDANSPGDRQISVSLLNELQTSLGVLGQFEKAAEQQSRTVALSRELWKENPGDKELGIELATQLSLSGGAALLQKDFALAEQHFQESMRMAETTLGQPPSDWPAHHKLWQILAKYSSYLAQTERYDEAQTHANRALEMLKQSGGHREDNESSLVRKSAQLHFVLGLIGSHTGKHEQSAEHWSESLSLYEILMARHPDVGQYADRAVSTRYSLALIKMYQDDLEASEHHLDANLAEIETLSQRFPDRDRSWRIHEFNCLNLLYGVCHRQDKIEDARAALVTAINKCRALLDAREGRDNYVASLLGNFYGNLGYLEHTQQNYESSVKHYSESIEILEPIAVRQQRGESVRWLSNAYIGSAGSHEKLDQYQSALDYSDAFIELVPNDRHVPTVRRSRIAFLTKLGQYDEAVAALRAIVDAAPPDSEFMELAAVAAKCAGIAAVDTSDLPGKNNSAATAFDSFAFLSVESMQRALNVGEISVPDLRQRVETDEVFESIRDFGQLKKLTNDD